MSACHLLQASTERLLRAIGGKELPKSVVLFQFIHLWGARRVEGQERDKAYNERSPKHTILKEVKVNKERESGILLRISPKALNLTIVPKDLLLAIAIAFLFRLIKYPMLFPTSTPTPAAIACSDCLENKNLFLFRLLLFLFKIRWLSYSYLLGHQRSRGGVLSYSC